MSIPGSTNPLLLFGDPTGGQYQIQRSLRFNASDSAYLSRTPAVAGNRQLMTQSLWIKRARITTGAEQNIFVCFNSGSDYSAINFKTDYVDQIQIINVVGGIVAHKITEPRLRDPSAWYHILWSIDEANGTAEDRFKLYINNQRVVNWALNSNSGGGNNWSFNRASVAHQFGSTGNADFYLADIHFIDGQALTPSSFTEVSATTGQLIPKTYSGSYGTNGFQLKFADNSSNTATTLGKDTSGNSNNWTPNNFSVTGILNYSSNVTTVATSVYSGTPATMFNGGTSIYYGVTSSSGNSSISIDLTGKGVSVSSSVRVYASFRTGMVWQINGSTVSSSGVAHPNTGWQTLSGWSAGAITSFSNSVPSGNANEIYAIEIDGVILTNNTGAGNDSLVDTPTSFGTDTSVGGEVRGNYCTLNPLSSTSNFTLSNGNLDVTDAGGSVPVLLGSIAVNSGKWYWEVTLGGAFAYVGAAKIDSRSSVGYLGATSGQFMYNTYSPGSSFIDGSGYNYATASAAGANDVVGVALNFDTNTITFYKNGTSQGTFSSSILGTSTWAPAFHSNVSVSAVFNFGQRAFAYTAPSGFKALCDTNLGAPLVAKPNTVMDVVKYDANNSTQAITGLNFSPDLVWTKSRSNAYIHNLYDTVRGATKYLKSNSTDAEGTNANTLISFDSAGFTLGQLDDSNYLSGSSVAWAWDAGTTTASNPDGSITSQVRANVSAGFSIVTFTSNASGNATVGHGLGVAPSLVILKNRTGGAGNWLVFHKAVCTKDNFLYLNSTNALGTYTDVQGAAIPSSTVFGINAGIGIAGSADCVAYVFSPVVGYGNGLSYVGNGSADGPFVYLGFRPKLILIKCSSTTGNWVLLDAEREGYNVDNDPLFPNLSDAEGTTDLLDITSNGFKIRSTNADVNASAATYIVYAWASNPFQYSRAR